MPCDISVRGIARAAIVHDFYRAVTVKVALYDPAECGECAFAGESVSGCIAVVRAVRQQHCQLASIGSITLKVRNSYHNVCFPVSVQVVDNAIGPVFI